MEKEQVKVKAFMGLDQDNRALLVTDDGRMFRTSKVISYMARNGMIYVETENRIYTDHPTKTLADDNTVSADDAPDYFPKR